MRGSGVGVLRVSGGCVVLCSVVDNRSEGVSRLRYRIRDSHVKFRLHCLKFSPPTSRAQDFLSA